MWVLEDTLCYDSLFILIFFSEFFFFGRFGVGGHCQLDGSLRGTWTLPFGFFFPKQLISCG